MEVKKKKSVKPLTFAEFAKRLRATKTLGEFIRRYEALKLYAAGVGLFDFELDYEVYEACVKGKLRVAKRLAEKRLSAAEEKDAKVLPAKKIGAAVRASDEAYRAFLKAHPDWLKPKHKPKPRVKKRVPAKPASKLKESE